MMELTKISYIYIILNKITKDFYLGSSNFINKRKSRHFNDLKKNIHHSIYLQRSFNKYGIHNFEFKIIKIVPLNKKLEVEQYFLNQLNPKFNSSKSALAPMEFRKHSEETKLKMSIKHKGNKYNLNKKQSDESRKKRSEFTKGRTHSCNTKMKMKETALRLNRIEDLNKSRFKILKKIIDSNGNNFNSITEASHFWKISKQTICDILKGRHSKTRKGISFKYE